jgi:hypothetical protein
VINVTIIQFYKNLFDETVHWRPKLDGLEFPLLDSAEADWLGRPYIYIYIHIDKNMVSSITLIIVGNASMVIVRSCSVQE